MPEAVTSNIEKLAAMKLPVVVGTTGWLAHLDQVRATVAEEWQRAGLESEFLGGRECVPARSSRSREVAGG